MVVVAVTDKEPVLPPRHRWTRQAVWVRSDAYEIGAATSIVQSDFTPNRLAEELRARMADPARLTGAAAAAKSAGITDAAERLAAIVLSLGKIAVVDGAP